MKNRGEGQGEGSREKAKGKRGQATQGPDSSSEAGKGGPGVKAWPPGGRLRQRLTVVGKFDRGAGKKRNSRFAVDATRDGRSGNTSSGNAKAVMTGSLMRRAWRCGSSTMLSGRLGDLKLNEEVDGYLGGKYTGLTV